MRLVGEGMYEAVIPPAGSETQLLYVIEARDPSGGRAVFPAAGEADPIVLTVTADCRPPVVRLERTAAARPGKDLLVRAAVEDPSGLRWVRLRYRHLTQFEDYQSVEMRRNPSTGLYEATIPGRFIVPEWDLMYLVEAVDRKGNGRMYPDLEKEMPYVVVELERRGERQSDGGRQVSVPRRGGRVDTWGGK